MYQAEEQALSFACVALLCCSVLFSKLRRRQFKRRQKKNIFPFSFVNPVSKVSVEGHKQM